MPIRTNCHGYWLSELFERHSLVNIVCHPILNCHIPKVKYFLDSLCTLALVLVYSILNYNVFSSFSLVGPAPGFGSSCMKIRQKSRQYKI
ncbi:hypothetical protein BpHYR1_051257 [Brachionus plicatilis]|uniref:Uncharacterized protein n=1 Tax=Brachionus plicatilis TaxID=10195 RepID=A0A3M7T969_BRAPC|nr:hypothetical protein BpHYR1_051257 [Brachionus plicatilis]